MKVNPPDVRLNLVWWGCQRVRRECWAPVRESRRVRMLNTVSFFGALSIVFRAAILGANQSYAPNQEITS
ncbi:hypothetical protein [Brucella vulpis]|uniref:hypothetical protein n=1 Tax=Brucella vulpis TaxID=981386 RepID=UPI0009E1BBE0